MFKNRPRVGESRKAELIIQRERERPVSWMQSGGGKEGEDFMIEIVEIRLTRKPETFHFPQSLLTLSR